jgi:ubiquinone/menaquinone biosynthesis C-methylase UbiE
VAEHPDKGFHFHTGRKLAGITGYTEELLACVPEAALACIAGTGNPFAIGALRPGERVVDLGCGAGMESFIAAHQVGPTGAVIGIDMTEAMLAKAEAARAGTDLPQLCFQQGYLEAIPVGNGWADVVISNGVVNLCPDKLCAFREMHRMLKAGGRLQIGDILVHKPVPDSARQKIDLWTG